MKNTKIKPIFRYGLAIIILVFMFYYVFKNFSELKNYDLNLRVGYIVLAFILLSISHLLGAQAWRTILSFLGVNISYKKASKTYLISQLGRYIPGKVWYLLGRISMVKKVPKRTILLSGVIELISTIASSLFIFLLVIWLYSPLNLGNYTYLVILFLLLILIFLNPKLINKILQLLRISKVKLDVSYGFMLSSVAFFCFIWCVKGIGFYFLINGIFEISIAHIFWLIGIYSITWTLGYLALLTPGGIGVREGFMVFLLSIIFPLSVATAIALANRILMIVTELVLALIALKLNPDSRSSKS